MTLVLTVSVFLGLYRYLAGLEGVDWIERVILVHLLGLGIVVPLGTYCGFVFFAAGRHDQDHRGVMILVAGALAWVFICGSLIFWFIMLVIGGHDR
jgi:hypothetical protein